MRALQTKEAAIDELEAYKEQIERGVVSFADLAARVSDCSSAKVSDARDARKAKASRRRFRFRFRRD